MMITRTRLGKEPKEPHHLSNVFPSPINPFTHENCEKDAPRFTHRFTHQFFCLRNTQTGTVPWTSLASQPANDHAGMASSDTLRSQRLPGAPSWQRPRPWWSLGFRGIWDTQGHRTTWPDRRNQSAKRIWPLSPAYRGLLWPQSTPPRSQLLLLLRDWPGWGRVLQGLAQKYT